MTSRVLAFLVLATSLLSNVQAQMRWVRIPGISARANHGAVFTALRNSVTFLDTAANGRQVEYSNGAWSIESSASSLPPLEGYAIAADPVRRRIVLFGGRTRAGQAGGTWIYDGRGWGSGGLPIEPPPRTGHRMAYDEIRQYILLFGGQSTQTGALLDDTWILDGNGWNRIFPSTRPSAQSPTGLAWDTFTSQLLLVGGTDCWTWNGNQWVPRAALPSSRRRAAVGRAPSGGVYVLHGVGSTIGPQGPQLHPIHHHWNGANWTSFTDSQQVPRLSELHGATLTYDPTTSSSLLAGGELSPYQSSNYIDSSSTVVRLGSSNIPTRLEISPPHYRYHPAFAFDSSRRRLLLTGGDLYWVTQSDAYEFDGRSWHDVNAGHLDLRDAVAAFDPLRARIYVFGGGGDDRSCASGPNPFWFAWDGVTKMPMPTLGLDLPPGYCDLVQASACFDTSRNRFIVTGGTSSMTGLSANTRVFEWDGSSFTTHLPPIHPPASYGAPFVYDPLRRVSLLHVSNALWEWNGLQWTHRGPSPAALLCFDTQRGVAVFGTGARMWDWDGTSYTERTVSGDPPTLNSDSIPYYDPGSGRLTVVSLAEHDVYHYEPIARARHDLIGAGCAASLGVPTPIAESLPWIGADLRLRIANVAPGQVIVLLLGLSDSLWHGSVPLPRELAPGMPGCFLRVSTEDFIPLAGGTWTVRIPHDPALLGASLFEQAVVFDSAANAWGMVMADAGRLVFGER